jgi:hypothetical protein
MQDKYTIIKNIYCILLHFWIGSFCHILYQSRAIFPNDGVIAISDVITLIEDMGNQIPDKSWMIYLLEVFNKQNNIPAELNLICSFNNDGKFDAIFNGVNQYQFKQILPIVGHSYLRQIIMNSKKQTIRYILQDQSTKQTERFDLLLNNNSRFIFEAQNHFTGIEWWNKIGNFPYPIRYHVQISQLMFGLSDNNPSDIESVIYRPYNALTPNSEGSDIQSYYPISFHNTHIKEDDGCICYNIRSGICKTGMKYLSN